MHGKASWALSCRDLRNDLTAVEEREREREKGGGGGGDLQHDDYCTVRC